MLEVSKASFISISNLTGFGMCRRNRNVLCVIFSIISICDLNSFLLKFKQMDTVNFEELRKIGNLEAMSYRVII